MKTRQEREQELQCMPRDALLQLYRELYAIPPGTCPTAGTLLIAGILRKEYPGHSPRPAEMEQ